MMRTRDLIALFLVFGLIAAINVSAQKPNLTYRTSWLGNSFPGDEVVGIPQRRHVQISVDGFFVAPDGTCFTDTIWDENGYEAGFYRNGVVAGACEGLHGWGRTGGHAVTADDKYIYVGMSQRGDDGGNWPAKNKNGVYAYPPKDRVWICVRRYNRSGLAVPFPDGAGNDGSMRIIEDLPKAEGVDISGLAVANGRLYVSDPKAGRVKVLDSATLHELGNVATDRPGPLAAAPDGGVWMLQVGAPGAKTALVKLDSDGKAVQKPFALESGVVGGCLAAFGRDRILVGDNGPKQQVRVYSIAGGSPRLDRVIGASGGIFAGTGPQIGCDGPLRFNDIAGVGSDSAGNVYVCSRGSAAGGGTVLECYAGRDFKRTWRLLGLEFVDGADADAATDGLDVFTKEEHFRLDPAKPAGADWTYVGATLNRFKYPQDPRLHNGAGPCGAWVRAIAGHRFLFTTDMMSDALAVFRFDASRDGEIAIPCGLFRKSRGKFNGADWPAGQPAAGEWIWSDKNANGAFDPGEFEGTGKNAPSAWGWSVDAKGNVWEATEHEGIREFAVNGLDSHGSPVYTYSAMKVFPMPAPLVELCRALYIPETDTMILAGYTTDRPHAGGEWGIVGSEVIRYDHWSAGGAKPALRIPLPYDGLRDAQLFIKTLAVAGDYVFAGECHEPTRIFVYRITDGAAMGALQPDATVGSHSGWIDFPAAVQAVKRADGEYLVFAEEDLDAKIIVYHWKP